MKQNDFDTIIEIATISIAPEYPRQRHCNSFERHKNEPLLLNHFLQKLLDIILENFLVARTF